MAEFNIDQVPPPTKLTPEDRVRFEKLDVWIVWLESEIKKAEECEFDVADMKKDVEKIKRQREAVLRVYV